MKLILILSLASFATFSSLNSCKSSSEPKPPNYENIDSILDKPIQTKQIEMVRIDFGYEKKYDSLFIEYQKSKIAKDSIDQINRKLAQELLHKKLVIENAKTYLNITIKNPKQDKFLKGWMRRALYQ